MQVLLDRGADMEAGDKDGWKALHYAITYAPVETVKVR